jgi:sugar phosphate isomerase/epimerase
MPLQVFRSLWTNGFDLEAALGECRDGTYNGIEGPVPLDPVARREFVARLLDADVPFIAEITTGGGYVPVHASMDRHLEELGTIAEASLEAGPTRFTALAGCDAWSLTQGVEFLGQALEILADLGISASFETHRSRLTFNPWITRDLLLELPEMRLTCDFAHWCCVCERLVMDTEPEVLALCAERASHVHARVGYDQGPQVPHPAAPEYAHALEAHERWWDAVWAANERDAQAMTTMTPEFGPDGYLQAAPFTGEPVASLDEINRWMAERQRERYADRQRSARGPR